MPRQARKRSKTGIYHIMIRGINRQIIFEEDDDYVKFVSTLLRVKEKSEFRYRCRGDGSIDTLNLL